MAQRPVNDPSGQREDPGGPGIPGGPVRRDPKNPARMTADPMATPFIDPKVSDPAALKYAQGAELRRRPMPIPKYTEPVAGGADTMIPRLDQEGDGRTMSEVARQQRPPTPSPADAERLGSLFGGLPQMSQVAGTGGIIEGTAHQAPEPDARVAQGAVTAGILSGDILPEAAQQDPAFLSGGGAMYAVNQPHLARKYGVIRNGRHIPGQALANQQRQSARATGGKPPAGSPIRDETLAQLETLKQFNERRLQEETNDADERVEQNALNGPAGGAGKTERQLSEQEKKAVLDDMDDFDLSRVRNAMFKDLLNNEEQRALIETRLKPLDLTELITKGRVKQTVPIKPGQFEPVFNSYSGEEDLCIKRLLGEESRSNNITDQYALDKYSLMGLTVSLWGINKQPLPEYRDENGDFNDAAFWKKYKIVARYDFHMLASLVANWFWFDIRVRKLWRAEDLGNG
jgi:hypothetical protein